MFVKAIEHFKCDELTRALWRSLLKFDVFDHFFKEKVAEMFWGAPPSPFGGLHPPTPCAVVLGPQDT